MTTDTPTFTQTIDIIRAEADVRRVTVSDDDGDVAIVVGVYYDNAMAGHFTERTQALFTRIADALGRLHRYHRGSEMDDYDGGDCDAVEVWLFEHS